MTQRRVSSSAAPPAVTAGLHRRRSRLAGAAASPVGMAALALAGLAFPVISAAPAAASTAAGHATGKTAANRLNCAAAPARCGFPAAASTGVPAGTRLRRVPGQVRSGKGWRYLGGYVRVTGNGAVLSRLSIGCNVFIAASHVTVKDVKVRTAGTFGISMRNTVGVTIENSTISGRNRARGRVDYAIDDVYGDSTRLTIRHDNISAFRTGVQITTGLITGNYIHDPGYIAGDHTNGIFSAGTTQRLAITGNTIFDSLDQTDAISLDASASGNRVANKTVTGNLLAGGDYAIYGGDSLGNSTARIVIRNNDFSQAYYPRSGQYGPVGYFDTAGPGNRWSANTWDTTGQAIPAP